MNNCIHFFDALIHHARVTDVAMHKGDARIPFCARQILPIACIRKRIQNDHLIIWVLGQYVIHVIGADKAGSAGHKDLHSETSVHHVLLGKSSHTITTHNTSPVTTSFPYWEREGEAQQKEDVGSEAIARALSPVGKLCGDRRGTHGITSH